MEGEDRGGAFITTTKKNKYNACLRCVEKKFVHRNNTLALLKEERDRYRERERESVCVCV